MKSFSPAGSASPSTIGCVSFMLILALGSIWGTLSCVPMLPYATQLKQAMREFQEETALMRPCASLCGMGAASGRRAGLHGMPRAGTGLCYCGHSTASAKLPSQPEAVIQFFFAHPVPRPRGVAVVFHLQILQDACPMPP